MARLRIAVRMIAWFFAVVLLPLIYTVRVFRVFRS